MISEVEKTQVELEFKSFTSRNFERPGDCRNIDQIRFYVRELCFRIEEYESRFNYAPQWAYFLLAQYNLVQNRMLQIEFNKAYA